MHRADGDGRAVTIRLGDRSVIVRPLRELVQLLAHGAIFGAWQ